MRADAGRTVDALQMRFARRDRAMSRFARNPLLAAPVKRFERRHTAQELHRPALPCPAECVSRHRSLHRVESTIRLAHHPLHLSP
jgi:hypothetical protein